MDLEGFVLQVPYLRSIAEGVRAAGGDVASWLGRSGLSEAELASASVEVGYERFEELIANAFAMTRQPALGLFVGQRMVVASHGMVGFAAMSSRTVREGLELIARYTGLRTSMISMALEPTARGLRIRLEESRPLGALSRPILEATVLSIASELGPFSGGACCARSVSFSFEAPDYEALAREVFGCEVHYGASWTGLEVPSDGLDAPLKTADPEALKETARLCERALEKVMASESMGSRVREGAVEPRGPLPVASVDGPSAASDAAHAPSALACRRRRRTGRFSMRCATPSPSSTFAPASSA